jgi:NAD(P)-dependent dehydrogenase (short-subunit alcohol dehydrogenase family)
MSASGVRGAFHTKRAYPDQTTGTGFMLCARYGKGHITQSLTVTAGTAVQKPMAGWSFVIGGGGALLAVVRNLAIDLAPLRVNCIAPGLVVTEMYDVSSNHSFTVLMIDH